MDFLIMLSLYSYSTISMEVWLDSTKQENMLLSYYIPTG